MLATLMENLRDGCEGGEESKAKENQNQQPTSHTLPEPGQPTGQPTHQNPDPFPYLRRSVFVVFHTSKQIKQYNGWK